MSEETKVVARIPLHIATIFTVAIALFPGFFFGNWCFTVWVAFVVWAEYFALGSTPRNWRIIFPTFLAGSGLSCLYVLTVTFLNSILCNITGTAGSTILYIAYCLGALVWVPILIHPLVKSKLIQQGSLPYFNGFTMIFAVYFTASIPQVGPMENIYWIIILSFIWVNVMAVFGWLIGYLNIALTFPKTVTVTKAENVKNNT